MPLIDGAVCVIFSLTEPYAICFQRCILLKRKKKLINPHPQCIMSLRDNRVFLQMRRLKYAANIESSFRSKNIILREYKIMEAVLNACCILECLRGSHAFLF